MRPIKQFFGMTCSQISILAGMGILFCLLLVLFAGLILNKDLPTVQARSSKSTQAGQQVIKTPVASYQPSRTINNATGKTNTAAKTPSYTATATETPTYTPTLTETPTATETPTYTATSTATPTKIAPRKATATLPPPPTFITTRVYENLPDTTENIHVAQIFNSKVIPPEEEIGKVDLVWGSYFPTRPAGIYNLYYYPFDRDRDGGSGGDHHDINWFLENHPDCRNSNPIEFLLRWL